MTKPKNLKILLVDDDTSDRELFGLALNETELPYQLTECENGKEALDYLENIEGRYPDVIFLDLNMPVMDGREALRNIKRKWPFIIVFIFSTSDAPHDVTNCYSSGANLFLVKPSDFNEIISMLGGLLRLFSSSLASANIKLVK